MTAKRSHQYRIMDLADKEVFDMTTQAIIVMLVCCIPIWGGLIYSIVRLMKMDPVEDDD